MIKLSILIPTVRQRARQLQELTEYLEIQAHGLPVEVLALYDNRVHSVGAKRNALVRAAQGMYLSFVDDDDWVAPTYVIDILEATESKPDVVVFDQEVTIDGGLPRRCVYGVGLTPDPDGDPWVGKPAHTHAWAEWIPRMYKYPDVNVGEDRRWADAACREVNYQRRITKVLYFYRYSSVNSLTRNPK